MLDNIECKSNGIPVTVDYACRYSLPIDDAREVIDKVNDSFESLNKIHDELTVRIDDAENKASKLENALDEWNELESEFDELSERDILLIDKVIQRIKKEGE